jgi:hypothetical protein
LIGFGLNTNRRRKITGAADWAEPRYVTPSLSAQGVRLVAQRLL